MFVLPGRRSQLGHVIIIPSASAASANVHSTLSSSTMPPKRPPKRGSDDDSDKKRNKRHAKNKRGGGEPTYDSYDEAMDGAIKQEEQGERYRDGDKAHRHYQRAKELYQKALDFEKTYDAAYNLARVHYVLATSFELPSWSIDLLKTSISLYRVALALTKDSLLILDASYNLAESLISLADQREDESSTADAKAEVREYRQQAVEVLTSVWIGQKEYLEKLATEEVDEGMDVETAGEVEAPTASMAAETPGTSSEEQEASYELYLPTASSLVDTALLLLSTHLTLWSTTEPTQLPSDEAQAIVRALLDETIKHCPPDRQIELDLQEIKVLLTVDEVVYDSVKDTPAAQVEGSGAERSLLGSVQAFAAVGAGLEVGTEAGTPAANETEIKADLLTSISEAYIAISQRLLRQSTSPEYLSQSWTYLSTAIQNLQAAQALRMPALTRREFEASTCILLSQAELDRARLSRKGAGFEPAKSNWSTLLTNAEAYCSKALEALGGTWKSILTEQVEVPALAGWDQELLARTAILQLLRVCHFAIAGAEPADQAQHKAKAEVVVENSGKLAPASRALTRRDVERFVEDLVDDEGALDQEEMAFWDGVEKAVLGFGAA